MKLTVSEEVIEAEISDEVIEAEITVWGEIIAKCGSNKKVRHYG